MPTLSTFLILKDEAPTVARAVRSVLPVTHQFVIGIDDKTTDTTEQIVRDLAALHPDKTWDIYRFTWENHFARARNAAIRRCACDWLFQLDGHEYLRSGSASMLQWYTRHTDPEVWLISVLMHLEPDRYGIPDIFFVQHHLWRNHRDIHYVNASHNAIPLDVVPDHRRLRTNDIAIVHQRPADNAQRRRRQRRRMNIPNFRHTLERDPDDPRSLFYLAQSLVDAGRPADAVPHYTRYLQVSPHDEEKYEAALKLGEIHALLNHHDSAADAFLLALRLAPTRAEAPFNLGLLAKSRIDPLNREMLDPDGSIADPLRRLHYLNSLHRLTEEASRWFSIAADTPPPVTSYFLRGPIYTYLPHLELARLHAALYSYTGLQTHLQRARSAFLRVLDFRPRDPETAAELETLEQRHVAHLSASLPPRTDPRPRLLVADSTGQFTPPLIRRWLDHFHVRATPQLTLTDLLWADLIFVEWCDQNLLTASQRPLPAPIVTRLWRYEAYSDLPKQITWKNVHTLIVPAPFLRTWLIDRYDIQTTIQVIKPGIDPARYKYAPHTKGPNVAVTAYLHPRKNLDEIADIAARLPLNFHIAGAWQDPCLERHFWSKLRRLRAARRVRFHGWRPDVDSWLDTIRAHYLLSASWSESFGYNIAEAMAKGIRPIVKHFEGADQLWPPELLYDHPDQIPAHLDAPYDSPSYRDFVSQHYNLNREASQYTALFNSLLRPEQTPPEQKSQA